LSRRRRKLRDPDQFDLFEPPHERCEDARGAYLQFLIAPPTELGEPGQRPAGSDGEASRPAALPAPWAAI